MPNQIVSDSMKFEKKNLREDEKQIITTQTKNK